MEQVYQPMSQITQSDNSKKIGVQGAMIRKIDVSYERKRVTKRTRGEHTSRSCGTQDEVVLERDRHVILRINVGPSTTEEEARRC